MSRPVRSTYFWSMGRERKYMREESNQSNERIESGISSESGKPNEYSAGTCPRSRDTTCTVRNYCSDTNCGNNHSNDNVHNDDTNKHGDNCSCPNCRAYNDYADHIATLIDPERERTSTGIWIGNELRTFKQTNNGTTNDVEYITGLHTGVTV